MNENKVRDLIAPSKQKSKEIHDKVRDVGNYILIALISIIVCFVVPLVSGCLDGDLGLNFPKTKEAWIIWIVIKLGSALSNVAIFVLFKLQAKRNIADNPNYIKANEIIRKEQQGKSYIPRSPKQMNAKEYSSKGVSIFLSTAVSSIVVTQLILGFDLITLISMVISTLITIGFGWTTMIKNEQYWTEEYLDYAEYISKINEEKKNEF